MKQHLQETIQKSRILWNYLTMNNTNDILDRDYILVSIFMCGCMLKKRQDVLGNIQRIAHKN